MREYLTHPGRLWPSEEQQVVLRAALLDGEAAVAAFRGWRGGIDLEADFGWPVLRLLPLVYANLLRLGVDDPLMGRLKGVYRRTWCENQSLFHKMRPVLEHLRAGGVDLLLLKGAPLALGYYGNPALRPMADLDVAVRPEHLDRALDLLAEQGWRGDVRPSAEDRRYRHAVLCRHPDYGEFDLHYHLLRDCLRPEAGRAFWAGAEPLDFLGIEVRQLEPTLLLFHTILHGVRWNEETPIRWIPDALTIVRRRGADIDWERLLDFAASNQLSHRLALGLEYLAGNFGLALPEEIRARVRGCRPSWRERLENTVVLGDYSRWYAHPLAKQWVIFANYCRQAEASDPVGFIVGYSHYLRYCWGLRGRSEIPLTLLNGLRRRLLGRRRAPC